MNNKLKFVWDSKKLYSELIAKKLEISTDNIVVKEYIFHSYITAYTSLGEYKVVFKTDFEEKGTYIESIVKVS
ncbi:hypothetical protein [Cytobacillus oceanisediminis]|uniref:hypothetical protein n=1 Tax=Cytobacillus oceanisediminis TaxID=665099 RepID=UPI0020423DA4|nr:hypothetical protein [Cytobacillus oceanisediminis]MCM3402960.1 hypothetical protein [Cytobacillus oceanisediminis]